MLQKPCREQGRQRVQPESCHHLCQQGSDPSVLWPAGGKSFQIGNARNSAGLAFLEQLDLGKQIIQPVIQGRCG